MIAVRDVHKRIGRQPVLRGVSLHAGAGECVAVVGPSGTGKSVLLKHVIGLLQPDAGTVEVDGVMVSGIARRDLVRLRRRMGYAFQDAALLDSFTVRDNLRLALDEATSRDAAASEGLVRAALERVNLDEAALDKLPSELSGGMRKRAGVARAVINRPRIVLYDEPTTGLDPRNAELVHGLIRRMTDESGVTSLVVTHDIHALSSFADRVVCLAEGHVVFDGPPALFGGDFSASVASPTHVHAESRRSAAWS